MIRMKVYTIRAPKGNVVALMLTEDDITRMDETTSTGEPTMGVVAPKSPQLVSAFMVMKEPKRGNMPDILKGPEARRVADIPIGGASINAHISPCCQAKMMNMGNRGERACSRCGTRFRNVAGIWIQVR